MTSLTFILSRKLMCPMFNWINAPVASVWLWLWVKTWQKGYLKRLSVFCLDASSLSIAWLLLVPPNIDSGCYFPTVRSRSWCTVGTSVYRMSVWLWRVSLVPFWQRWLAVAPVFGFVSCTKPQVASFNVQQRLATRVVFLAEDGFAATAM